MSPETLSLFYALGATLSFSTSSLAFAEYSKKVSVLWMNTFKALVALIALTFTIPFFTDWHTPSAFALGAFFLSGFVGLGVGDMFLLNAFTRIGVARTLILFGFQPLFVGVAAYFLFGQELNPLRFVAVIFLIACLFIFSLERYKSEKRWEIAGLMNALIGVALDSCGILLTRAAFANVPAITPLEGHFYRCIGALAGFAMISYWQPFSLFKPFLQWNAKSRFVVILASLGGTYLSLIFYLSALKIGHLASVASIAITGPIFATALESLLHRKAPSPYLLAAFAFFGAGFYILLRVS